MQQLQIHTDFHRACLNSAHIEIETKPFVGILMPDGTRFVGISPTTQEPIFVQHHDVPYDWTMYWEKAMAYAANCTDNGKPAGTFRLPEPEELNLMFLHRSFLGDFNASGKAFAGYYYSAKRRTEPGVERFCYAQRFDDGTMTDTWGVNHPASIRLVCD